LLDENGTKKPGVQVSLKFSEVLADDIRNVKITLNYLIIFSPVTV
jgi:hypothetical protein